MRTLLVPALFPLVVASIAVAAPPRVLFVRGGPGTGGFLGGGADLHLSDVGDLSTAPGNAGWGELAQLLAADGFAIEQVVEGPGPAGSPVDLAAIDLAQYAVVVLGSNNAVYPPALTAQLVDWVCAGGGALFVSDANFGSNWGDAPDSDQAFLDRFDLEMNQDGGTYAVTRAGGDFVIGGVDQGLHPILAGPDLVLGTSDDVDAFDGEGVSPATVTHLLFGVEPTVIAKAKGSVHQNDAAGSGSFAPATVDDGSLVVLEYGAGRGAGHFDRTTLFNLNGAGTSLHNHDNAQLASNLFAWLAGPPGPTYGDGCPGTGGIVPQLSLEGCAIPGQAIAVTLYQGLGGAPAILVFGAAPAALPLGGGCFLQTFPLLLVGGPFILSGAGAGLGTLTLVGTIPLGAPSGSVFLQGFVSDSGAAGGFSATNGLVLAIP